MKKHKIHQSGIFAGWIFSIHPEGPKSIKTLESQRIWYKNDICAKKKGKACESVLKGTSFFFQLESHIISFNIKNDSNMLLIKFGIKVRVVLAPFLVLKSERNTAAILNFHHTQAYFYILNHT